ncbi:MAG: acyl-CoA thioesterase [Bacteroidales bacterium]|nr:acyl-CoA thioesterase [Bacteroidales bacterium]
MLHFETKFPVRYYETDQMGIVHHSNYIRYFECARNTMMAELGYPIEQCEADGVTIPIVSVSCRYHHPAKMGDVLTVTAEIEKAPLAKLVVEQTVLNQKGELLVSGQVVLGFLNKENGYPVRCPEKLVSLIDAMTASEQ